MYRGKLLYIPVIVVCSLLFLLYRLPIHFDIFSNCNIRNDLELSYGSEYPYILNYYSKDILGVDVVISTYSKVSGYKLVRDFGINTSLTGLKYVDDIVEKVSSVGYCEGQNNPNKYKNGLDCQGYSIIVNKLLDLKDISNKVVYTSDHMYNQVTINGSQYVVDLAKHKFYKLK